MRSLTTRLKRDCHSRRKDCGERNEERIIRFMSGNGMAAHEKITLTLNHSDGRLPASAFW